MTDTAPAPIHIVCPHCDAINRLPTMGVAAVGKCGRCHQPLFDGKPVGLTGARFARHVASNDIPVIVDFWAAWCGPCQTMGPIFERAAAELEPRARFVKVDVDAEQAVSRQYGVRGIPALFLLKGGKVAQHHSGVADVGLIRSWLSA